MHRILLLNSKGGCGKTTLATNLAAALAGCGLATVLIDYDGQGSSSSWLRSRAPQAAPIHGIEAFVDRTNVTRSYLLRVPEGTDRVVIDTPANVKGQQLADLVERTDSIVVPVLSSQIDIDAVAGFLDALRELERVRAGEVRIALVANRTRAKTVTSLDLQRYLQRAEFAFVTQLRDSQNYLRAVESGRGVHELRGAAARRDREQWAPLLTWVEDGAQATADVVITSAHASARGGRAGGHALAG
ncbi:MAG: ParA family protein [Pseudomonadota bacterium]